MNEAGNIQTRQGHVPAGLVLVAPNIDDGASNYCARDEFDGIGDDVAVIREARMAVRAHGDAIGDGNGVTPEACHRQREFRPLGDSQFGSESCRDQSRSQV